jgi:hypothetical protein
MTTFYCLRFEIPSTWRAWSPYLYPPGTGWPSYTPRHWVPFSSPPTTCRVTMKLFDPASTRGCLAMAAALRYIVSARAAQKTSLYHGVFSCCRGNNVSTELFPSNGCSTVACLHSCYLAMVLHVPIPLRHKTMKEIKFKLRIIMLGPALLCWSERRGKGNR